MKERITRLKSIRRIIKNNKIESQEELLRLLLKEGFEVTQATLSRDLKLLKVGKISDGQAGYFYTVPADEEEQDTSRIFAHDFLRGYMSIDSSANIIVIKTFSGHASSVANALDNLNIPEVLGTVAGDNCLFACLKEGATSEQFMNSLKNKIPELHE